MMSPIDVVVVIVVVVVVVVVVGELRELYLGR